jgi:cytochrome c biogenesis protein CcmG/thiol:disulfide interchange protein DsbE
VQAERPRLGPHGILPQVERTRPRWRRLVLPAALAVALLGAVGWFFLRDAPGAGRPPAPSSVGRPAPQLAGPTLDGGTLDLAQLRGGVVVVTVWAAWCGPCREELPVLVAAQRSHAGLRLVGIDTRDGERQARELLAQLGGDPATSVVDPDGALAASWDVAGVPETFVVDAGGTVRARHLGPVGEQWLDDAVAPLLPAG